MPLWDVLIEELAEKTVIVDASTAAWAKIVARNKAEWIDTVSSLTVHIDVREAHERDSGLAAPDNRRDDEQKQSA
jgi:hypothetical protein